MKRLALGVLPMCILLMLVAPASSHAVWQQQFCGIVLQPWAACSSGGPHSLDRSQSWYPGAPAHHVKTCTYLYNSSTGVVRGGVKDCRWSENGAAYVSFGPTTGASYYAFAENHQDTCCAHTIWGWTRTTY
jgi:hypothetical protein